jgi:magnesium-transporting ATPase (P-type)
MSVIVLDKQTNEIVLLCKGADSIVKDYLTEEEQESDALKKTMRLIDVCAIDGLRTLLLAKKVMSQV